MHGRRRLSRATFKIRYRNNLQVLPLLPIRKIILRPGGRENPAHPVNLLQRVGGASRSTLFSIVRFPLRRNPRKFGLGYPNEIGRLETRESPPAPRTVAQLAAWAVQ